MKTQGLRILDRNNDISSVKLKDILEQVSYGEDLCWCILWFDGVGIPSEVAFIEDFMTHMNELENGLLLSWADLNALTSKIDHIVDITILGAKSEQLLHFYENPQQMYECCNVVIEMIDSSHWEVFSIDQPVIDSLTKTYKKTMPLASNHQIEW